MLRLNDVNLRVKLIKLVKLSSLISGKSEVNYVAENASGKRISGKRMYDGSTRLSDLIILIQRDLKAVI